MERLLSAGLLLQPAHDLVGGGARGWAHLLRRGAEHSQVERSEARRADALNAALAELAGAGEALRRLGAEDVVSLVAVRVNQPAVLAVEFNPGASRHHSASLNGIPNSA